MEVNVVGIQVVRNVTRFASPCLEGGELMLRLAHIAIHVAERTQSTDTITSIRVYGIPALVYLFVVYVCACVCVCVAETETETETER